MSLHVPPGIDTCPASLHPHALARIGERVDPEYLYDGVGGPWDDPREMIACHDFACRYTHGDRVWCETCESWVRDENERCPAR